MQMETTSLVLKTEAAGEACAVCGAYGAEGLRAVEEHDALAAAAGDVSATPLRAQLLHLAHNKPLPAGPVCGACARRASEAYSFSVELSHSQPLSDKIRALRRRLHQLTEKIDVFIVVGANANQEGGTYSEQDIIMVERSALAAAAAADELELERAHNARGDRVYQCSLCPYSFQRLSEFRAHSATHGAQQESTGAGAEAGTGAGGEARHSCWTCGAQYATRADLALHATEHRATRAAVHHQSVCGACGEQVSDRAALSAHAAARHHAGAAPPYLCPVCFAIFDEAAQLSAHSVRHRVSRSFVCGHAGCVSRFMSRAALLQHIRTKHAAQPPPLRQLDQPVPCAHCYRTFGSVAAMKRHARVHAEDPGAEGGEGEREEVDLAVEYLEMDALDDAAEEVEIELKPQI